MKKLSLSQHIVILWGVFCSIAIAQWSTDPLVNNPVCTTTTYQADPVIAENGAGGAIIAWEKWGEHPMESSIIYAQNFDANGNPLWPGEGVIVSVGSAYSRQRVKIVSDGKNGAIVTWHQTNSPGLSQAIVAQRVAPDGTFLWAGQVSINGHWDFNDTWPYYNIASDNNSGVLVAWDTYDGSYTMQIVHAQRIDSSGNKLWNPSPFGVIVSNTIQRMGMASGIPVIVGDGMGGAFVAWEDGRPIPGRFVYAQYINSAGTTQWDSNGVVVSQMLPDYAYCKPQIACNASPTLIGPVIAWKGVKTNGSAYLYSQQLFPNNGQIMWPNPLMQTLTANVDFEPVICAAGEEGGHIVWGDSSAGTAKLYFQSFESGSTTLGSGILLCDAAGRKINPAITPAGIDNRGAIVTWQDNRDGNWDIYAQHVEQGGTQKWAVNGMKVTIAAYDQVKPKLAANGEASAIAVWQDGRSGTNFDIYASRFPMFGAPVCASPADSATQVSIQPLLKWLPVTGAGDYYFQLAADSLFFSIVREGTANDTLTQITATLNNARTYYWRVKGIGGQYSARSSFTTVTPVIPILNFPILNATVYTLTPELHWNITVAPAGIKFDVYLSTDSLFASGYTTTLYADSAMQITLATLLPTTHYYWKVRSKTASGEILSYSERADFTTFGTLVVPNPSWPTGGATVYSNNPTLYWYMSAPAYTYTFQVRYKPTASGVWSAPVSAGSDMNVQIHGLTAGTSYDWQVQSFNGTAYSDWSASHSFVTYNSAPGTPPQPVLSYPTSGVTSYTFSPILYWYISASSAGIDFTVNVSKNSDFSAPVQIFTPVTNLYQQLNNLDPGSMYYWRVQSFNGATYSTWSAVDSFYIFNLSGNLTPVLTYPLGGTTVYSATPALYWYTLGGGAGTQYEIQYALDTPSFTGSLFSAVPSCTLPTLEYGGKYFWRVRTSQGATTSNWSGVDSFEVTGKAGSLTPILTWPVGGALSSNSPILYWYVNSAVPGMSFSVEYADNEEFTSPTAIVTTDYFTTLSGLASGVTYSWRVRTWNGSHFSPYSSPATFVTTAGTEPARPMCGSPVNGVVIGTNAPMLSWFLPVAGSSLTYELQYAATPDFTNPVTIPAISTNRYITGSLAYSMPVFWRVRSKTAAGVYSAYSEPERFVPVRPTAVSDGGNNPFDFVLTQNYPNPFNPGTIISYQVPGNKSPQAALQQVTLTIYDMLGREVTTLINTMQQPGGYRVYFNASSLPSGVYIYKLQAGTLRQVKKMVLQK